MRVLITLLLIAMTTPSTGLYLKPIPKVNTPIIPFEWFYQICSLESSHRLSIGVSQVKKAAIRDINRVYKTSFTLDDDHDYKTSFEMFCKYIFLYNKDITLKSVVKTWRYGPFSKCKFLHRGYYKKLNTLLNNFYMASKSIKPSREDLKSLKVGESFDINKSLLISRVGGGFLLKTKSGNGIFQCKSSKSMVEYLKNLKS